MKTNVLFLVLLYVVLSSCGSKQAKTTPITEPVTTEAVTEPAVEILEEESPKIENYDALVFSVKLGVSAQRPNWVLFKNGSYMLFKDPLSDEILTKAAIKRLQDVEVTATPSVRKSNFAQGWTVTFGNSGIYNYVDPKSIPAEIPNDSLIIEQARKNLTTDKLELNVIHINKKK